MPIGNKIGKILALGIHQLDPLLPVHGSVEAELAEKSVRVLEASAALGAALPSALRARVVERVRSMNSYYSNLIEGHVTHPLAIDRALAANLSSDPSERALQLEAVAYIEVQKLLETRISTEPALRVCSPQFVQWLHQELFRRMPPEFLMVRDADRTLEIVPGGLRQVDVRVGKHLPPPAPSLPAFLQRFDEGYEPGQHTRPMRLIACCAAHHRLAWIHPFLDGNGRVTRLHSEAYLLKSGLAGYGLWTFSRGLARRRESYLAALTFADAPRAGDLDGRGARSLRGLERFCDFMLETALDQVDFMAALLQLGTFARRIEVVVERLRANRGLRPEARYILIEALRAGDLSRGDAKRVSGLQDRTAQQLVGELLRLGLLVTSSEKGPVSLGLPAWVLPDYFPSLFPTEVEDGLRRAAPPRE